MALNKVAAGLVLFVASVLALQDAAKTATLCPVCYTQTIVVDPPVKTCPPLPSRPIPPACGIVCLRQAQAESVNGPAAVTTVTRPTTVIVATVTATLPGRNPACPTTDTITLTRTTTAGGGAATPDLICPLLNRPDCACSDRPAAPVEVLYTVLKTATVFVTAPPLTCAPLPTSTPAEKGIEPTTLSTATCTSYITRREPIYCLDGRGEAAAPQTTAAPVYNPTPAASGAQTDLPPSTRTRGCTVTIIERPVPCPERGI
ncbi:hypothetical protein SEUCBS140593_010646 [Sporothrix eucalyptigena]|uniref:Uncharacterized protein n=1 Tax=Sporothrix eucalyptigena TaxID=1812306 RepID=A0ABP0D2W9_9PEZI